MKSFLNKLDHDKIVAAIGHAEEGTSGEVRLHLHHRRVSDPVEAGKRIFEKLGMTATAHRNGVLLFVAPRSKKFAVLGDRAIHEKCGDDFWSSVAGALEGHFRKGNFTDGLVAAIETVGEQLRAHFPTEGKAQDELPNEIDES